MWACIDTKQGRIQEFLKGGRGQEFLKGGPCERRKSQYRVKKVFCKYEGGRAPRAPPPQSATAKI